MHWSSMSKQMLSSNLGGGAMCLAWREPTYCSASASTLYSFVCIDSLEHSCSPCNSNKYAKNIHLTRRRGARDCVSRPEVHPPPPSSHPPLRRLPALLSARRRLAVKSNGLMCSQSYPTDDASVPLQTKELIWINLSLLPINLSRFQFQGVLEMGGG